MDAAIPFMKLIFVTLDIRFMNLASLDLNLLLVFDAVMNERNATRAGERIGMSQPAVSNALNRLRYVMRDELFLRGPDGMRPTARALELEVPVRRALSEIEQALDPVVFDPATASRTFTVATTDYASLTLLPYVARYLMEEAPGINLHTIPIEGRLYEKLDAQEVQYGLTALGEVPGRFGREDIGTDHFVCLMRNSHPLARYSEIPIDEFAAARHLLVTPRGDANGFVDDYLRNEGLSRQIAMTVNGFGSVPMIIEASDLIVSIPSTMAEKCCEFFDLKVLPCPVPKPEGVVGEVLIWHQRLTDNPAHSWFRDIVKRAGADLNMKGISWPAQPIS